MNLRACLPHRLSVLQLLVTILVVVAIVVASFAQGAGTELPTSRTTLGAGDVAIWNTHDSPTTQNFGGGSRDQHRIIRWASDGMYSSRKTYAVFGFRLVEGIPGRMYDFHTQPNDVGGWRPACNPYGIAPLAIDYWGNSWA